MSETKFSPRSQDEGSAAEHWARPAFLNLRQLIGAQKADNILSQFRKTLSDRFNDFDGETLRREAHALCSTSGMLGFGALSDRARALEQSCGEGGPTAAARAEFLTALRIAEGLVDDFLAGSAAVPPASFADRPTLAG